MAEGSGGDGCVDAIVSLCLFCSFHEQFNWAIAFNTMTVVHVTQLMVKVPPLGGATQPHRSSIPVSLFFCSICSFDSLSFFSHHPIHSLLLLLHDVSPYAFHDYTRQEKQQQ